MSQHQPYAKRTPNDIERLALLDVLTHVILSIRNHSSEMTWEQISQLADAVHNIPIYLSSHEALLWETILWDLQNYDSYGYDLPGGGSLMEYYRKSTANHGDDAERPLQ